MENLLKPKLTPTKPTSTIQQPQEILEFTPSVLAKIKQQISTKEFHEATSTIQSLLQKSPILELKLLIIEVYIKTQKFQDASDLLKEVEATSQRDPRIPLLWNEFYMQMIIHNSWIDGLSDPELEMDSNNGRLTEIALQIPESDPLNQSERQALIIFKHMIVNELKERPRQTPWFKESLFLLLSEWFVNPKRSDVFYREVIEVLDTIHIDSEISIKIIDFMLTIDIPFPTIFGYLESAYFGFQSSINWIHQVYLLLQGKVRARLNDVNLNLFYLLIFSDWIFLTISNDEVPSSKIIKTLENQILDTDISLDDDVLKNKIVFARKELLSKVELIRALVAKRDLQQGQTQGNLLKSLAKSLLLAVDFLPEVGHDLSLQFGIQRRICDAANHFKLLSIMVNAKDWTFKTTEPFFYFEPLDLTISEDASINAAISKVSDKYPISEMLKNLADLSPIADIMLWKDSVQQIGDALVVAFPELKVNLFLKASPDEQDSLKPLEIIRFIKSNRIDVRKTITLFDIQSFLVINLILKQIAVMQSRKCALLSDLVFALFKATKFEVNQRCDSFWKYLISNYSGKEELKSSCTYTKAKLKNALDDIRGLSGRTEYKPLYGLLGLFLKAVDGKEIEALYYLNLYQSFDSAVTAKSAIALEKSLFYTKDLLELEKLFPNLPNAVEVAFVQAQDKLSKSPGPKATKLTPSHKAFKERLLKIHTEKFADSTKKVSFGNQVQMMNLKKVIVPATPEVTRINLPGYYPKTPIPKEEDGYISPTKSKFEETEQKFSEIFSPIPTDQSFSTPYSDASEMSIDYSNIMSPTRMKSTMQNLANISNISKSSKIPLSLDSTFDGDSSMPRPFQEQPFPNSFTDNDIDLSIDSISPDLDLDLERPSDSLRASPEPTLLDVNVDTPGTKARKKFDSFDWNSIKIELKGTAESRRQRQLQSLNI